MIRQDSVKVLKTDKEGTLFCADLNKLKIYVPKKSDDYRTSPTSISNPSSSIDNLLGDKGAAFFSSKDSLYLMQQNSNPKLFLIDTEVLQTIKCTSMEVEQIKIDHHKPFDFYQMTLPVFSKDNKIAYVELNHYCSGGLCGSGQAIYLKKLNGRWVVSFKKMTWMS